VESVSKGGMKLTKEMVKALRLPDSFPVDRKPTPNADPQPTLSRFTPIEEIDKALARRLGAIDINAIVSNAVQSTLDKMKGRV
jgi:hypothetical protein